MSSLTVVLANGIFETVRSMTWPARYVALPGSPMKSIPLSVDQLAISAPPCEGWTPGLKVSCLALKSPPTRHLGRGEGGVS